MCLLHSPWLQLILYPEVVSTTHTRYCKPLDAVTGLEHVQWVPLNIIPPNRIMFIIIESSKLKVYFEYTGFLVKEYPR